ncbi:unnamed protein product [Timema podura]|uniref:Peptidase S1 domain-containing protein n=1 Tax=Timema podura TaxID=61482 RepID=A0ABN7NYW3_TIMPD|nr:unnamed protein product [Timema podura]
MCLPTSPNPLPRNYWLATALYLPQFYKGLYSKAACKRTPKIINGVPNSIEQFPFMAKLLNTYTDMGCAANIISEIYALTAALCTEGRQYPDDIILEVGTSYWNVQGVRHTVRNVIDHRGYNFPNNDISLLEVSL